jgi:hypothetical protein
VTRNCVVDAPALCAMFVKKMVWGARIATDPYEMVPIYVMYHLELATARMHPKGEDLSNIECDYCSIFVGLCLATLREEQANCSEITSEHHLVEGCFAGITDREKSNEPQKMVSRPFLMPQRGLLPGEAGKKWSALFMDVTRPVQRGGILLREHDGPSGDPGGASKMFHRPMDKRRVPACFRALIHKVASVPEDQLWRYGLSSLRKFLPNIGRANKLDYDRSLTG